jgi:hypothetical protein
VPLPDSLQTIDRVRRLVYLVPLDLERRHQEAADVVLILDHEDTSASQIVLITARSVSV